ncbi:hypothetical protein [Sphingomonas sp.]|uniref:hypothetical protein n=1 Tax=Sphingomonas sp. TaxID=28214 RepID=UPI00307D6964
MLRPARFADTFRLVDILEETRKKSRYSETVNIDAERARKTLAGFIQRHGGVHDGGTCVFVVEDAAGAIQGFCVGTLYRVYLVGDRLVAQDMFLICTDDAAPGSTRKLINAYLDWAGSNPNVVEINLSWSDALPTGQRMGPVYHRLGFVRCGEMYRRHPEHEENPS